MPIGIIEGLAVVSTLLSLSEQRKQGDRQSSRAAERGRETRARNEVDAGQVIAIGQRRKMEEERRAELIASRAIAVASAGGYAADIDQLLSDIDGEGAYNAHIAMYEAESESERLKYEGLMAEKYGLEEAEDISRSSRVGMLSTLISGGASLLGSFSPEKIPTQPKPKVNDGYAIYMGNR